MLKLSITEQYAALGRKQKSAAVKAAKAAARLEGKKGRLRVSLLITNDEQIQRLNKQYRQIDKSTDVLSFPSGESGFLGDIAISLERAKAQAEEFGHSLEREIAFLVAHSMLHLFGYEHENEQEDEIMRGRQREILKKAGFYLS